MPTILSEVPVDGSARSPSHTDSGESRHFAMPSSSSEISRALARRGHPPPDIATPPSGARSPMGAGSGASKAALTDVLEVRIPK